MALKSIRARALACSAVIVASAAAAHAEDALTEPFAAKPAPTKPFAMTKPKGKSGDSGMDSFFSAIGTKKGMLLGWTNTNTDPFAITAFVQRFTTEGKAQGKPDKLEAGILEGMPQLFELGGDKFGVIWKSSAAMLKGAVIDAGKGKVGKPVTVLDAQAASYVHDAAALGKDKVALVTRRATGFNQEDTILVILNAKTLKPVGSPKVIEKDTPGPQGAATWEQGITAYAGGAVALFHDSKGQITGVPVDSKGKAGKSFKVNSTTMQPFAFASSYPYFNVKGAPTDDGGFVATWLMHDQGSNSNFNVRARVFDKKGKPVGADFIANADLSGHQVAPEVLPYKKGFAIAWTDFSTLGAATHVMRFFDPEGQPISGDIVTHYFEGGSPPSPIAGATHDTDFARLPGDAYLKVFAGGFGGGAAMYGDGIPAPKFGSSADETIDGTEGADLIIAAGGADDIAAGGGDDTIDGGAGDDTIDGGAGKNLIAPGPGDDVMTAGPDAEIFVFAPGEGTDEITGFGASDRIDVSAFHYNNKDNVRADAAQVGDDVVLTLNGSSTPAEAVTVVRLKNKRLADLTDANIIL